MTFRTIADSSVVCFSGSFLSPFYLKRMRLNFKELKFKNGLIVKRGRPGRNSGFGTQSALPFFHGAESKDENRFS